MGRTSIENTATLKYIRDEIEGDILLFFPPLLGPHCCPPLTATQSKSFLSCEILFGVTDVPRDAQT